MEELAIVSRIDGDKITLVSEIKSSCQSCSQNSTCANGQIAKAIPQKKLSVTVSSDLTLTEGDKVVISLPEQD